MKTASTTLIPATILTGFLGSGKTTLLNRILSEHHGQRIAVIENEFGEAGIDNELLVQDRDEHIVEMNNGCICCTVRGDLVRILADLAARRGNGELAFDRVVIETTGLADPAPVAQTFFVDEVVRENYALDAIITVVDAKHAQDQLTEHHEAQEQVGFADRILVSKTDLVAAAELDALTRRLRAMNPRATIKPVNFGRTDLHDILNVNGFDLDAALVIDPSFLTDTAHEHDDDIQSFVIRTDRHFDIGRLEDFIGGMLHVYGPRLFRYKGVLNTKDSKKRIIFQGVHMLFSASEGPVWKAGEKRSSTIVFIGRDLPEDLFRSGLEGCQV
jgi:G3E family GTPase